MDYIVTLTFQFPAYDEQRGISFEVTATSKSEAIKKARWQATKDGHLPSSGRGLSWLKAVEAE